MPTRKQALTWLSCLLLSGGGAALAEAIPSAVGRISYGGDVPDPGAAICTGVLVAPDLVLTAAHCVRRAANDPGTIRFDAGWAGGVSAGYGQGAEVILSGSAALAEDVALVVLQAPLPPEVAEPLSLAVSAAGVFRLHAFRRDASDQPSQPQLCRQRTTRSGLLGLDCPAVSGNSGAPLLQRGGENWNVVAVMVAASGAGPVRSWAAPPPDWVLQHARLQQD